MNKSKWKLQWYAYTKARTSEEKENILQAAYLSVYKCFDMSKPLTLSYFQHAITSVMINMRRKEKCDPISLSEEDNHSLYNRWNPETLHYSQMTYDRIITMIDNLPDTYREVTYLSTVEGVSYKEIATRLNICTGTVKSRLNRGKTILRKGLKDVS